MKFAIQSRISLKDILTGAALSLTVVGGAFLLTLSGCTPNTESTTFKTVYNDVLSQSCVTCHSPGGQGSQNGATLDFTDQTTSYRTIFSNVSGASSSGCTGFKNIVAGSPSTSYLLAVEDSSYNTTSGSCTPITTHLNSIGVISAGKQAEIVSWVNAGALNN